MSPLSRVFWSVIITLGFELSCFAQVHVTYTPVRIGSTQAVFGPGKSVGFWVVSLYNNGTSEEVLSWEKILSYAPSVPWYTNQLGQDLASRQAASAGANRIGAVWDAAAPSAGAATSIAGMFLRSTQMQYAGFGLMLLSAGVKLVRKNAPDPTPYYSRMLPDQIRLVPDQGATFYTSSGLVHSVGVLVADIPAKFRTLPLVTVPQSFEVPVRPGLFF